MVRSTTTNLIDVKQKVIYELINIISGQPGTARKIGDENNICVTPSTPRYKLVKETKKDETEAISRVLTIKFEKLHLLSLDKSSL